MLSVATIAVRAFLLLFGIVVLGLSVTAAKQQVYESVPSETSFSSFAGAFGIIVSAIGLVSIWVDKIPTTVVIGADILTSVFYLAGGIALAIALKSVNSCTSNDDLSVYQRGNNKLLTGGCFVEQDVTFCAFGDNASLTIGRCQRIQADYAFEFLGFVFGIAIIVLGWMVHKRGGRGGSAAYV